MRRYGCQLCVLIVANLMPAAAAISEDSSELRPQPARVTSPGAAIRSGPGEAYFLTDMLPQETPVEVYRQQEDGWCAIRPPAESFSWVFSQNVRLVGDGLAEIEKEDVAARVGSRLSLQRDVVQVRLRKGEKIAILGRDERDGSLWYKIAPPAGEFRWVQAKDIGLAHDAVQPVGASKDVTTASLEEPIDPAAGNQITAPPLASENGTTTTPAAKNDQWTAAPNAPPATSITPIGAGVATSANLSKQLSELELRLSRMVAESPATWNVGPLEQSAEQLLSRADTLADREAVKSTLGKIDRFAAIQRRYQGANVEGREQGVAGEINVSAAGGQSAASSPYDAVGILRPVVSRRPGAPQFALVNAQGQVVTFVTATPDVNLQPFIGQRIGVSGSRGYIPEFRRAHVTAGRVTPINDRMLR